MQPDLKGRRIMVAVLNWGLGHATRSMPVIDELLLRGAEVFLAGDGPSLQFLHQAYPHLKTFELPAYNIRYPTGFSGAWKTVLQAPSIIKTIQEERLVIESLVEKHAIDAIIADNRYGAHASNAVSVFMCHQLSVLPPKGFRWAAPVIFRWHKSFFSRFDNIWIPDFPGDRNLSGRLSHDLHFGMPCHYIGPLSRFTHSTPLSTEEGHVLVLLSGPEPQRTILEELLVAQLPNLQEKVLMVRGVVEDGPEVHEEWLTKVNYYHKEELFQAIQQAKWIICRPGYSTLMDLSVMNKKALLIPTPGQTEQEYLAENLANSNVAILQRQNSIDLQLAKRSLKDIHPIPTFHWNNDALNLAIEQLSKDITNRSHPQK